MRKVNVKSVCPGLKKFHQCRISYSFRVVLKIRIQKTGLFWRKEANKWEPHTFCSGPVFFHQALALHNLAYQKQNLSEKDAHVQTHRALIECWLYTKHSAWPYITGMIYNESDKVPSLQVVTGTYRDGIDSNPPCQVIEYMGGKPYSLLLSVQHRERTCMGPLLLCSSFALLLRKKSNLFGRSDWRNMGVPDFLYSVFFF